MVEESNSFESSVKYGVTSRGMINGEVKVYHKDPRKAKEIAKKMLTEMITEVSAKNGI